MSHIRHIANLLIFGAICLLPASPTLGSAEVEFPQRTIKLVVPFSPGGGSDSAGRLLKRAVERSGGFSDQSFVVVNVPGGGGTIGSRRVKNAAPDGHTLLLLHEGMFTAHHSGQATYGSEAFEPVAAFGRTEIILAVSSKSPFKSLSDLIGHCRSNPDSLTFACNLGAPAHFIGLQLEAAAGGIQFRFVPSGGGAKRYGDLIGGEVEATIFAITEFAAFQGGGIRPLAIFSNSRHPKFPEIPTASELDVPLVASNLQFIWAPLNTPEGALTVLADGFQKALSSEVAIKDLTELHIEPVFYRGKELELEISSREQAVAKVATVTPVIFPWFPHIVIGLCLAIATGLTLGSGSTDKNVSDATVVPSGTGGFFPRLSFIGTSLAYAAALALGAPFLVTTIVFTAVSGAVLTGITRAQPRQIAFLLAFALGLGFGCHLLFTRVLSVDLP